MTMPPVSKKLSPHIDDFLFRPFDLGLVIEVIKEDGTSSPVLIEGTFIDGLWHKDEGGTMHPVLDPNRNIEPNPDPDFYAAHGCGVPVELKDTPYAEEFANA